METEKTKIDGVGIRYAAARNPGAAQVVLTSPQPESILAFDQHWPALAEEFDVVAVDLPNHGHSDAVQELTTVSQQAEFFGKVLDHFELDRAHFVGPDVGTPLSLRFMADNPDGLASAVVGDAGCVGDVEGSATLRSLIYRPWFRSLIAAMGGANYVRSAARQAYKIYKPPKHVLRDYIDGYRDKAKIRGALGFLGSYPDETPALERDVTQIETPVLILHGDKDVFSDVNNSRRLHDLLPASELYVLEG
ncbi:MAG: alpha/beta fold hydrolase, partial [Solirubrobacterales bacterium]